MSSTDLGVIYGSIVFQILGEDHYVVLNDLFIDVVNYIRPSKIENSNVFAFILSLFADIFALVPCILDGLWMGK